jgi:hypothetical protein
VARKNLHLLYPFLNHKDEDVRIITAHALTHYPELSLEILPLLESRIAIEEKGTKKWLEQLYIKLKRVLKNENVTPLHPLISSSY